MQYETIILELLTRIKKLEDEVSALWQRMESLPETGSVTARDSEQPAPTEARGRMTEAIIDLCYRYGKRAYAGDNIPALADTVVAETGMNRSSAIIYLYAVKAMLEGTVFKRAISEKAIRRYFDLIFREYGKAGLARAIQAVTEHVAYRRSCGHMVDSLEVLCADYAAR